MERVKAVRLEQLETQFRDISSRAATLMRSVDGEAALRRPAKNSWSAVECLEHLNLSADPYFPLWEKAIPQAGPESRPDQPYRMDFWGRVLYWMLEPPPRMRFPTSRPFVPIETPGPAETLKRFLERQERIVSVMSSCPGRAIDRVKIASPFSARVHYSVWSSFVVTAAHERRHLWQAERAIRAIGVRNEGGAIEAGAAE